MFVPVPCLSQIFRIRTPVEVARHAKRRQRRVLARQQSGGAKEEEDDEGEDEDGEEEGKDGSVLHGDSAFELADFLAPLSLLRCSHPVRGADFSPVPAPRSGGAVPADSLLVSLSSNALEVYRVTAATPAEAPQKTSRLDLHGHRSDVRYASP